MVGLARRRSRWDGPFNAFGSWRGRESVGGFFGSVIALDLAVVTSGKCNINAPPLSRRAAFCAKGKGDLQHDTSEFWGRAAADTLST